MVLHYSNRTETKVPCFLSLPWQTLAKTTFQQVLKVLEKGGTVNTIHRFGGASSFSASGTVVRDSHSSSRAQSAQATRTSSRPCPRSQSDTWQLQGEEHVMLALIACSHLSARLPDPRDHWVPWLSPDQQVPFPSQPVPWFAKHDQPTRHPELCSETRLHLHRMEGSVFLWVLPGRRLDAKRAVHSRQQGTPVACNRHYQGEHCISRRIHDESPVFYSLWLILGCIIKNKVQVWSRPR